MVDPRFSIDAIQVTEIRDAGDLKLRIRNADTRDLIDTIPILVVGGTASLEVPDDRPTVWSEAVLAELVATTNSGEITVLTVRVDEQHDGVFDLLAELTGDESISVSGDWQPLSEAATINVSGTWQAI